MCIASSPIGLRLNKVLKHEAKASGSGSLGLKEPRAPTSISLWLKYSLGLK